MSGKILGLLSAPGGVGKTTIAASLGWLFRESGKRVLLIDMDPSISLSWLVVRDDFELMDYEERGRTLTRIFQLKFEREKRIDLKDFLITKRYPSDRDLPIDLIIPDLKFTNVVDSLWVNRARRETMLRDVLEELGVRERYDLTIIDTIPFFDRKYSILLTYAVDKMIVPLRPAIIDVYRTQTMLKELPRATALKDEEVFGKVGILFNMVRANTRQARNIGMYTDLIRRKVYAELKVFETVIPYYVSFSRIGTEEEQQGDRDRVRKSLEGLFSEIANWVFS